MIVTLTPNPSLDYTVELRGLRRGEVLRADRSHVDPGGKGVNVSRALAAHGRKTTAVLFAGGAAGSRLTELLDELGVAVHHVAAAGDTRANITIAEPDGTVTKLNLPGPVCPRGEATGLLDAVLAVCGEDTAWVAGCGSLPPGADDDTYARLVTRMRGTGVRVAVDSSGPALAACLAAGPDLVKPNRDELAECAGLPVRTLGDAVRAAEALRSRGARTVLASLGADGAVLVGEHGAVHGEASVEAARSSVGAGDALLAGFLAAGGGPEGLRQALAWGAAATGLPGSRMPAPADVDRVGVTIHPAVEDDRVLEEGR
ncbi:1-phosphofructokinase [Prauserella muralis]|uniref:1-phosphofructokinase n=1 Tax=Prauserella muralis TaxID=588067 RepID=A0A2V4AZM7_9PSEU|nr:1-phosphofructokinase [Prauserella muralis]PXY27336.1 1-phosphofructokinase [Prauserella muralis]TWE22982.1 1-phosphofructokinase [Prauserella muralis]